LSRQIAVLEDAIGVQVFDRSRGGATLIDAGESLLRIARQLLQTRVEVVNAVQAIQQAALHPFRLGFSPSTSSIWNNRSEIVLLKLRIVTNTGAAGLRNNGNVVSSAGIELKRLAIPPPGWEACIHTCRIGSSLSLMASHRSLPIFSIGMRRTSTKHAGPRMPHFTMRRR
jgi:hypothetical protein